MKMKMIRVFALCLIVLSVGCTKDTGCKSVSVDSEKSTIETYNAANGITATRHSSGLYYQIITPGSASKPVSSSRVYVRYTGELLTGETFDSQSNPGATGFSLSSLIEGWKIGIPLIGKGGKILLTIPSALGYGCQGVSVGTVPIPSNAPLYFEIELVDFL